jgi:hypothetical protein
MGATSRAKKIVKGVSVDARLDEREEVPVCPSSHMPNVV